MNKLLTAFTLPLLLLLTGCLSEAFSDRAEIDRAIDASPEQAAAMLDQFDTIVLSNSNGFAIDRYVILRAKVAEAAGRPAPLDSLLEQAISHCESFPESKERAFVNYYAGISRMKNGHYAQAIVDFANSLHTIRLSDGLIEIRYPELPGRIHLMTAQAYAILGDSVSARTAIKRAVDAFTEAELDSLVQVAAATPLPILTDSVSAQFLTDNSALLVSDNIDTLTRRPDESRDWYGRMAVAIYTVFLVLLLAGLYIFNRNRMHRCERREDLAAINHYINLLNSATNRIEGQNEENAGMRKEIADLAAARYEVLNALCDVLFSLPDSNRYSDKLLNRITDTIKSLGTSDRNLSRIESEADRHFSNIIARLRSELPDLKEDEIRLFLYIVIGFTPRTLSVILDLPLETVYNRKSYLKRKIKSANTLSRADFLRHL